MSDQGSVVVTGASTGIGAACALALDEYGYRVFAGIRKPADGDRLKERASERLTPTLIDVTDADSIAAAAELVSDAVGEAGLAGLVNNAGISVSGPLEFVAIEDLRRQLEVNVTGQVAVTQAFLPLLRKAKGRIVNIGSNSGRFVEPLLGPYCASKFALEAVTDSFRMELAPSGIEVSIIQPGAIQSEIWDKALGEVDAMLDTYPEKAHEYYGELIATIRKLAVKSRDRAADPSVVTDALLHALTARRPRTRYPVGPGGKTNIRLALLPDRLKDRLVAWFLAKGGG